MVAVIVMVAALVSVAVAVTRVGSGDGSGGVAAGTSPPGGPLGPGEWLVPTWIPERLDVWDVDWDEEPSPPAYSPSGIWTSVQLFGDPDAGRALYVWVAPTSDHLTSDDGRRITVRGRQGRARREDLDYDEAFDAIEWHEEVANIRVLLNGVTTDQAIRAVEAMEWRTGDPRDGFAPPPDGSFPLRGEVLDAHLRMARSARFDYWEGPPDPWEQLRFNLGIVVSIGPGVSVGYLDAWFSRGDDEPMGSSGPRYDFDDDARELRVSWPDGSEVTVTASPGDPRAEREVLEHVVHSMAIGTDTDLAALRDRSEANIDAVPVIASAETTIGTLELHGEDNFEQLCLRAPNGSGLDCGESVRDDWFHMVSWVVADAWYVAVAAQFEADLVPSRSPGTEPLVGETATDGYWHLLLVQPPPDVDAVEVPDSEIEADSTGPMHRPT